MVINTFDSNQTCTTLIDACLFENSYSIKVDSRRYIVIFGTNWTGFVLELTTTMKHCSVYFNTYSRQTYHNQILQCMELIHLWYLI